MHYILLKGSDDQSRVAVNQELKRLRKRVKELEEQIEIFKLSNEALQQDNLDLSYDKVDLAYEYAQEMAEHWKQEYEEEIEQLKQSQNQVAISELEKLSKHFVYSGDEMVSDYGLDYDVSELKEEIEQRIKELKGENNENI